MFLECIGSISWWKAALNDSTLTLRHRFQKQSALSQFYISAPQGLTQLSVPTVKKSRKGTYGEVLISYEEDWQVLHWRSIQAAYAKAPFFIYYDYKIEPLFKANYRHLHEFNWAMVQAVSEALKWPETWDLDRDHVLQFKAINQVELREYPQVFDVQNGFVQDAGILDLLFNLGPEALSYLQISSATS